jgi:hypothetical protein
MRSLSICLMLEGVLWALVVGWTYLSLSGISEPVSATKTTLYFAALLIVPLVLIVGPVLVLKGAYVKLGAILAVVGCAVLTIFVVYQSIQALHVEPLEVKPPYALYVIAVIVTLLSDVGALRLYQLASSAGVR